MFKEEETTLKNNMSARRRDILSVKKLNLLKSLLDDAGHGDISLVDDLSTSFDLTGALPESHSFAHSLIFLWRAQKGSTPLQGEHTWNHQIIWRSWIGINCMQPPWKKLKRGSLKDPWTWNLCLKEPFWRGGSGWSKKPRLILLIITNHPSWTVVSQRATVQKCTTRRFFRLGQWPQLRTAFLRVSLVLWKFGTKLLNLIWSTISSPLRTWNPVVPLTWWFPHISGFSDRDCL